MSDRLTCARCDGLADVRARQSFLPDQAALSSRRESRRESRRRIVPRQYPGRKLPDKTLVHPRARAEQKSRTEGTEMSTSKQHSSQLEIWTHQMSGDDWRLDALIDRLPKRLRDSVRALRQPSGRWLRIPAGLLLMAGGVLAFLPILGLWMLPIGLALLADDVPLLRSWRSRMLDWVERSHPDWLDSGSRPHDPS